MEKSTSFAFDKGVDLFNATELCSDDEESALGVHLDASVNLTTLYAFQIAGTMVPSIVTQFVQSTSK